MLEVLTNLVGRQVYSDKGVYVGVISNVILDLNSKTAEGIFLTETNPNIVDEGVEISIPFRWIQAINDIILLKHFPERINLSEKERALFERERAYAVQVTPEE